MRSEDISRYCDPHDYIQLSERPICGGRQIDLVYGPCDGGFCYFEPDLEPEAIIVLKRYPGQGRYQFDQIDKKYHWVN